MRKLFFILALAVGLLTSASTLQAQTANMSRYITLTVKSGKIISFDFKAAANGTPIHVVNGSDIRDITVDSSCTSATCWAGISPTGCSGWARGRR